MNKIEGFKILRGFSSVFFSIFILFFCFVCRNIIIYENLRKFLKFEFDQFFPKILKYRVKNSIKINALCLTFLIKKKSFKFQ